MAAGVTDDTPIKTPIHWLEHFEQLSLWQQPLDLCGMRLSSFLCLSLDVNLQVFCSGEKISALVRSRKATVTSVICCCLLLFRFNSLPCQPLLSFFVHLMAAPRIHFVWSLTCLTITPDFPSALPPPAGWCRATKQTFHHEIMPAGRETPIVQWVWLISCVSDSASFGEKSNCLLRKQGWTCQFKLIFAFLIHTNTLLCGWLPCS